MFVFREIWCALLSSYLRIKIHLFVLLPAIYQLKHLSIADHYLVWLH